MSDATVAAEHRQEPSLPQRIWGVLVSPRVVFESLKRRPRILGALLVLIVINVGATLLLSDLIAQQQVDKMEARSQATPEQIAKVVQITRITAPIGAAVGTPVVIAIVAGVLLFIGNILLGGASSYREMFSGTTYAQMVGIPAVLVKVPLSLAKHEVDVQTSLAAILPTDASKTFLYHFLARFDVFALWTVALSVIMMSVMAGVTTKKAAWGVVGAWGLWSVLVILGQTFIPNFGRGM